MFAAGLGGDSLLHAQGSGDPIQFENSPNRPAVKPILGIVILLFAIFCLLKPLAARLVMRHQPELPPQTNAPTLPPQRSSPYLKLTVAVVLVAVVIGGIAVFKNSGMSLSQATHQDLPQRVFPPEAGSFFMPLSGTPLRTPQVREIPLPQFPGSHAIWGATGRDQRGHIWLGVTTTETEGSAHLLEFDPESGQVSYHGNVVEQLKQLGIDRPGEKQSKIHSKIYAGEDGYLYFSSMDEEGEEEDGSQMPIWGGHLWRMRLSDSQWEHLAATPEALIGVAVGDRWVYALGYFGHVLYQYDNFATKHSANW